MPFPPVSSSSTTQLQTIVNWARTQPGLTPVLGVSGYQQEPALTFSNDVMQKIFAQGMDWSFNQKLVPSFITVALQQDYVTQITDIGYLQGVDRVDINNSTNSGNLAPKPLTNMEVVRDLKSTSVQSNPAQVSFVPNYMANMGQWTPNTIIPCGYGVSSVPSSPIQQFLDANQNILYIDSTTLNLNINSPGFMTTPIVLPTPNPYGITGSVVPALPPNAPPGTTILDGTVTWTVANPSGYAIRINPLPAQAGLCWLLTPIYQVKAPRITSLQQYLNPLPDDYIYLFRSGFLAMAYDHAGSPKATAQYAKWEEQIMTAIKASDRSQESFCFFPSEGIMGGGAQSNPNLQIGPANPFSQTGY